MSRNIGDFMTVLIVDDDPDALTLINKYVSSNGYETLTASSGEETLEVLGEINPDAIILDAVMPGYNGLDVIREIKKNKETCNIPVIMVSALGPGIKLMLDEKCQADHYMSKPFSGKELNLILSKLIQENEEIDCWVNYNKIRKEARVHGTDCVHLNTDKLEQCQGNWMKYTSIETARQESMRKGFDLKLCKICMPGNGE